ncbi:MAG: GNAT family N-acetyltransferase [Bacteroidota bacterium]
MTVTYKILGPGDSAIARALTHWFQTDDGIAEPNIPTTTYMENLLQKDDFHIIVAYSGEQIIGGVTGYEMEMYMQETRELFLYEIGVHEGFRQRGIAKTLIGMLKDICMKRGVSAMYVGTWEGNEAAERLYAGSGGKRELIPWFTFDFNK